MPNWSDYFPDVGAAMPEAYGASAPVFDPMAQAVMAPPKVVKRLIDDAKTGDFNIPNTLQAAMLGMGGGIVAGAPDAAAGEMVLGSGPMRRVSDFMPDATPTRAANANVSQAEVRDMIPPPLSRADRDWQNYGSKMSPDDVTSSEAVWGAANHSAEAGHGRAEGFAQAANDLWQRMGANRYITPEQARQYMAVEEAKMRGIGAVPEAPAAPKPKGRSVRAKEDSDVSRSTDLPSLRGLPVDEATAIARQQQHLIKAGDQSEGYYVGGPREVQAPRDLDKIRNDFYDYVGADPRGGDWYDRYRAGMNEVTGGDPTQNKWMSNQHGQWSAGVSPEGELGFTLKENNGSIAGVPVKSARPAQHEAHEAAIAAQDPGLYQLGAKTGEYARRINPDQAGPPTATGVNDFRHARNFKYTEAGPADFEKGTGQKNALTDAQHQFLDYETAIAVDRANRTHLAGRNDWTGEQLQAAPWVRQKALDFAQRLKIPYEEAFQKYGNRTIADYFDKHTAFGTHEAQPGAGIGHLPGLETAPKAERDAYAADPRSRWDFAPGNRDAIYSGTGIPGTGVNMRVRPSLENQGAFEGPNGMEYNRGMTARPLVAFDSGKVKSVPEGDRKLLDAGEGLRAFLDAQHAGAWHKPWVGGAPGESNSLTVPMAGKATPEQIRALRARGAPEGLPDVVDTGQGVTMTNFGGDLPKDIGKPLKKGLSSDIEGVTGSKPSRVKVDSGYLDYDWSQPGSGKATQQMLDRVTSTPEIRRAMNANTNIPLAAIDRLQHDAEVSGRYGGAREDIQNARRIIANSAGDWIGDLQNALKVGSVSLPVVAALVGPAYQQMVGGGR